MRSSTSLATFLSLNGLFLSSYAWPLIPSFQQHEQKRQPQSYSVVPVDGGSSTGVSAAATKTVTNAVTTVRTSVITSFSTIVVTESDVPSTTVVPQTITIATTIVSTVDAAPTPAANGSPVIVTASPATVTVQPSVTSGTYDNGQWHTTYYWTSTLDAGNAGAAEIATSSTSLSDPPATLNAAAVTASTSTSISSSSSTSIPSSISTSTSTSTSTSSATSSVVTDPGSWQSWSNRGNNGSYVPGRWRLSK